MRILLAHNRYQQPGGEDVVFEQESNLLSEAGHEVDQFIVSNDRIGGTLSKIETALNVLENRRAVEELADKIASFKPEVVHFHNFFPRMTPAAVRLVVERNIPALQTLHNFRHVCANGMFLRQGSICQLCLNHPIRLPAMIHRCYRHSAMATFAVTRVGHRFRQLFDSSPSHLTLIALTSFARDQMVADGYSPSRIFVKPNSVPDHGVGAQTRDRRVLFAGRVSVEKGVDFLIELARSIDATFEIVGDGPESQRLRANAPGNVVFRGRLEHEEVLERIKNAAVVVVPSRWFEGFPMTVLEAFSAGTPVIASRIGSLAEVVEDGVSGLTREVDDHDAWKAAIQLLLDDRTMAATLGQGARLAFENKYTNQQNLVRLMDLYSYAIDRAHACE
jgi:glycosyltransferase involved in cell wall biosynthesis